MKGLKGFLIGFIMATTVVAWAAYTNLTPITVQELAVLISGEDQTHDVLKVEQQFSYSRVAADASVKSGAGFLHTITCSTTAGAAATAGAITLYDNTAESGTSIQTIGVTATAFNPYTLVLDVSFGTGLYVGYDGTAAGVNCTVAYR